MIGYPFSLAAGRRVEERPVDLSQQDLVLEEGLVHRLGFGLMALCCPNLVEPVQQFLGLLPLPGGFQCKSGKQAAKMRRQVRSEERRVGKECVSNGKISVVAVALKKQIKTNKYKIKHDKMTMKSYIVR